MPSRRRLLLLALAAYACGASGPPPEEAVHAAAEEFLADLRDARWPEAYGRLHADRQVECSSPERLGQLVVASGEQPTSWTLREPRVRPNTGLITGETATAGGDGRGIVELAFDRAGDRWQITAWSASNRELCRESG